MQEVQLKIKIIKNLKIPLQSVPQIIRLAGLKLNKTVKHLSTLTTSPPPAPDVLSWARAQACTLGLTVARTGQDQ